MTGAYIAGPPARPAGGHLPAHRGQPRLGPLGVRRRHAHPVRQPLLGLLRSAAQRHPDHPRHAEPAGAGRPRPRRCSSKGLQPDRQRRAGHRRRGRAAAPPPPAQKSPAAAPTTTTTTTAPPSTTTTTVPCGLLGAILGCPKGSSGSNGSSTSKGSGSSQGGLGGLLSNQVTPAPGSQADGHAGRRRAGHDDAQPGPDADRAGRRAAAPAAPGPSPGPGAPHAGTPRAAVGVAARRGGLVLMRAPPAPSPPPARRARCWPHWSWRWPAAPCRAARRQRTATAYFSDVGDLANGAQVQMADVPVGSVSSIALERGQGQGHPRLRQRRADPGRRERGHQPHHHPRRPVRPARRAQERDGDGGRHGAAAARRGRHRAHLDRARRRAVRGGGIVRSSGPSRPPSSSRSSQAGGEGFTGQEASLKAFLADLTAVTNGYAQHTDDITQAVNGLNSLSATLAPTSSASAAASRTCRRPSPSWPRTRRSSRRCCSPSTTCRPRGAASSRTTTPRS